MINGTTNIGAWQPFPNMGVWEKMRSPLPTHGKLSNIPMITGKMKRMTAVTGLFENEPALTGKLKNSTGV